MTERLGRSPVQLIVETFTQALGALGAKATPLDIERWAFTVHRAMASHTRLFHTHEHVLDLVDPGDPLGTLAALFHDLVYVHVDNDISGRPGALLAPLLRREAAGWRVLEGAEADEVTRDVLRVFARQAGALLTPFDGLNELASALVAAKELQGVLTRAQRLSVAACIEATIPFREHPAEDLVSRLEAQGLALDAVHELVARAMRLANDDVANFAEADAAHFLDNTWKLLPETNPSLQLPTVYGVREYRVALMRMEGFLSKLPADRIFHAWRDEPLIEVHQRRVETARRNIALAVRYLRAKLFSIAVVEALSEESGGDMPLDYFMGGLPEPGGPLMDRLENHLQPVLPGVPVDEELQRLLDSGRAGESDFDLSGSPLASFLTHALGEARVLAGVEQARAWWDGRGSAADFLARQPAEVIARIAEAAARIASTRAEPLRALARRLRG